MEDTPMFTIPKEKALSKVDNSSNSFKELIKVIYYMFPNIVSESYLNGKEILKSFFNNV